MSYPNDRYRDELARLSEFHRVLEARESLMRHLDYSPAIERAAIAAEMTPDVLAAAEVTRLVADRSSRETAMDLIRQSSLIVASGSLSEFLVHTGAAASAQARGSVLVGDSAREIASAAVAMVWGDSAQKLAAGALPQAVQGESAREMVATALPTVLQMYGGTVHDIIAASLPSLEMTASLRAASSVIGSDFRECYEPLAATARATAEIQALLGSISISESRTDRIRSLTSSLSALTSASKDIWNAVPQHDDATGPALSGWLLEAPVVQTYEASRNIVQLTNPDGEITDVHFSEPSTQFREQSGAVSARLEKIGKQFLAPYRAAHAAVKSKREDYARQATAALRELLDQLLSHLAPDPQVKTWPDSAKLLKNEPRKARLHFLFRDLLAGAYARFVEKDIDLILQTFYALNKGVHSLEAPYTETEVRILVARIDGHLLMLLEAGEIERRVHTRSVN